jgi:hypothetical protein
VNLFPASTASPQGKRRLHPKPGGAFSVLLALPAAAERQAALRGQVQGVHVERLMLDDLFEEFERSARVLRSKEGNSKVVAQMGRRLRAALVGERLKVSQPSVITQNRPPMIT